MNWVNRIETLISKSLSKIGLDGMAHIIVCQNLIIWLSKFFGIVPLWEAIIITIAIFILKEIYEKYCKKTIKDIICDCVGLALGVLTLIL